MSTSTIQEIELAIGSLTSAEREELYAWLDQRYPHPIDARIATDLAAGHLDAAIRSALDDEKNGRTRVI